MGNTWYMAWVSWAGSSLCSYYRCNDLLTFHVASLALDCSALKIMGPGLANLFPTEWQKSM